MMSGENTDESSLRSKDFYKISFFRFSFSLPAPIISMQFKIAVIYSILLGCVVLCKVQMLGDIRVQLRCMRKIVLFPFIFHLFLEDRLYIL